MAQAKKGKKKASGPDALAIMYGFEPGSERNAAVRAIFKEAGIRPKLATAANYEDPLGSLAHLVGFRPCPHPYEGEVHDVEVLVFCNVPRKTLDAVLAAMREAEIDIPLKAVLTDCNMRWSMHRLIHELSDEHAQMCGE